MTRNIKRFFNITSAIVFGSVFLMNCEPEADSLGSQFFTGAEAVDVSFPLIAYNVNNENFLRADAAKLDSAVLGAFTEAQFGLQKPDYITQVRLSAFAPDFGDNPVLDSAVMVIKPAYYSDSITTTTTEDYTYNDADNTNVAAKKVVSSYRIKKYGKTKLGAGNNTVFNIKVHEVSDFLGATSDSIMSNKTVLTGAEIGSKTFNGNVVSVKITKDTDASELFNRDANIRIPLDSTFFQNKIIAKEGSAQLADAATFIRYFRGLKISVQENDGYLFKFAPNAVEVNLYYKNDQKVDNVTKRKAQTLALNLGASNVHYSQINYNRAGSALQDAPAMDTINGNHKLFLQGMGGPGAGFKIPVEVRENLKNKFKNDKVGIISAKIRIYTEPTLWNNKYTKPDYFVVQQKGLYSFLEDMSTLSLTGKYNLVKRYNLTSNPAHYDIGITQTLKNIIEKEDAKYKYRDFIINVGNYTYDPTGSLIGASYFSSQNYNTRAYTPNRAVFVGTVTNTADPLFDKGAKLLITYGQK